VLPWSCPGRGLLAVMGGLVLAEMGQCDGIQGRGPCFDSPVLASLSLSSNHSCTMVEQKVNYNGGICGVLVMLNSTGGTGRLVLAYVDGVWIAGGRSDCTWFIGHITCSLAFVQLILQALADFYSFKPPLCPQKSLVEESGSAADASLHEKPAKPSKFEEAENRRWIAQHVSTPYHPGQQILLSGT